MTRMLALLCALLFAVVALELTQSPDAAGHPGTAVIARPAPQVPKQAPQAEQSVAGWTRVALARPLFAPDRKPVAGSMASDPGMPRLTGIIASPQGAVAIFQPAGQGKPVVARPGERVGGWELTEITADAVDLRKANELIVMNPRFAGIQHAAAAAEAKVAARPRWEVAAPTGLLRARWSNPQLQP
ncbi:MAG: hypothetical protein QOH05_800 [Acetobacteraceae bacterium]|jgi:hypothetical protein|nr:hypothetical protein [Acetobacteraceae bacterium]